MWNDIAYFEAQLLIYLPNIMKPVIAPLRNEKGLLLLSLSTSDETVISQSINPFSIFQNIHIHGRIS
jgi:hypothetical protein